MNGLLVIDKPSGMTSRDALNRVQRWFPPRTKIGHTGTLDPLATGVLVVCIGAATRLADYVQAMDKSYRSRFRLGAASTTDDADGVIRETADDTTPMCEEVERVLASFVGTVDQVPPAFSALKVAGRRAHALARTGDNVPLSARPVRIDAIRVTAYDWPWLDVEVDCGKGTYIRSIARDVGAKLGCGGLVQTLRRTRIGPFTAEQGIGLNAEPKDLHILPLTAVVSGLPRVTLDADSERRFRSGQSVRAAGLPDAPEVAVLDQSGELVGIGASTRGIIRPILVLNR